MALTPSPQAGPSPRVPRRRPSGGRAGGVDQAARSRRTRGPPRSFRGDPEFSGPSLQILVVVANIRVRGLRAEAEQGFVRTALVRESGDPEAGTRVGKGVRGDVRRGRDASSRTPGRRHAAAGGVLRRALRFEREPGEHPRPGPRPVGHGEGARGDAGPSSGKSFLFSATVSEASRAASPGGRGGGAGRASHLLGTSGTDGTARENPVAVAPIPARAPGQIWIVST